MGTLGFYTDVYALAATLYYFLTVDGLKAKDEYIQPSFVRKLGPVELPPPQYYNSRISKRVNDAIMKGMELEIENRPQTVGEFRELLGLVNIQKQEDVELKSFVGMDYTKLRDLLAAGMWEEADEETTRVMLLVAEREENGWLDNESVDKFPCEDLRTIDQLWVKYSDGKFGFSVQKHIYQSLGGTIEDNREVWEKLEEQVGWRNYERGITFNITEPQGHLPSILIISKKNSVLDFIKAIVETRDNIPLIESYYLLSRPDL
jgi:hypothetical protein